jgi:transposase-like protein
MDETPGPGAVETQIAHRYGIATNLVFTWRRRPRLARFGRKRPSIDSPAAMPGPGSAAALCIDWITQHLLLVIRND